MLLDMPALRKSLARNVRLLGLDPGAKTIGVALSDVAFDKLRDQRSCRDGAHLNLPTPAH